MKHIWLLCDRTGNPLLAAATADLAQAALPDVGTWYPTYDRKLGFISCTTDGAYVLRLIGYVD